MFPESLKKNSFVTVFKTGAQTSSSVEAISWIKPYGKTMLDITLISGGHGGGGGFSGASTTQRGGGGGGGSSNIVKVQIPLFMLPDELYITVGIGGAGGAAGANGTQGKPSYVTLSASVSNNQNNCIASPLSAGAYGGSQGFAGTGTGGGAAGNGAIVASASDSSLSNRGVWNALAGQSGVAGGAGGGVTQQTFPATGIVVMGGCAGAGTAASTSEAGGGITAISNVYISENRPLPLAAGSVSGSGGYSLFNGMFSYPGLGGSSSNAGIGGDGGDGGFGSGGGGGGGGTTGGKGGNGGSGLVTMIAW